MLLVEGTYVVGPLGMEGPDWEGEWPCVERRVSMYLAEDGRLVISGVSACPDELEERFKAAGFKIVGRVERPEDVPKFVAVDERLHVRVSRVSEEEVRRKLEALGGSGGGREGDSAQGASREPEVQGEEDEKEELGFGASSSEEDGLEEWEDLADEIELRRAKAGKGKGRRR